MFPIIFFQDCDDPNKCKTCPGGSEFTGECPTANICRQFQCTNEASCSNRGSCNVNTGSCDCRFDFVGKDCSLEPRKTFFIKKTVSHQTQPFSDIIEPRKVNNNFLEPNSEFSRLLKGR